MRLIAGWCRQPSRLDLVFLLVAVGLVLQLFPSACFVLTLNDNLGVASVS